MKLLNRMVNGGSTYNQVSRALIDNWPMVSLARSVALISVLSLATADVNGEDPRFIALGDVASVVGPYGGFPIDMSRDGKVVILQGPVSENSSTTWQSFVWREGIGLTSLGIYDLLDPQASHGYWYSVTGDGTTAIGDRFSGTILPPSGHPLSIGHQFWVWQAMTDSLVGGGTTLLSSAVGTDGASIARAANYDGSIIVGSSQSGPPPGPSVGGASMSFPIEAAIWNPTGLTLLGYPPDGVASTAWDVSGDGSVVLAFVYKIVGSQFLELPYFWSQATGFVPVPVPGTHDRCWVGLLSHDGRFAVGGASTAGNPYRQEAVLWTPSGPVLLPQLQASDVVAHAEDLSDDGNVIVGSSATSNPTPFGYEAVIWIDEGVHALKAYLTEGWGIDLGDWHLDYAHHVSADGRRILGVGINPSGEWESWIAVLGNTSPGLDVVAELEGGHQLHFDQITLGGETTVTVSDTGPTPPSGFRLVPAQTYYDITTTAQFTGTVEVCLSYDDASVANEGNLKLMHYENGAWVNITTSLDTVNNVICGVTASLSPFIIVEEEPVLPVSIDIKPGSYPNSINLGSNGVVPVAIFGAADFDATQIDPTTVRLADAAVKVRGNGTSMAHFEDVNGDGRLDLVVQVSTQGLQLTASDTQAVLTAETADGRRVRGSDTVRVVN